MNKDDLVRELKSSKEFFDRSSRCLVEEDSTFAPVEGTFTVAQQVAHVAQTIDWFIEGAFNGGFDSNFEQHILALQDVRSLKEAREWLEGSFSKVLRTIESKSMDELTTPLPEGPIMGGAPRLAIVGAIVEHTAHHRGALAVYSRLRGHVPAMPYAEMG